MTIIAFASINHATYGGVYYCANFTTSGAITWAKLTTTGLANLEITHFRVDYGDPLNKQFVRLSNEYIYYRNGGNWIKVLDHTIAAEAAGESATGAQLSWLYTDPTVAGTVYSVFMTDHLPFDAGKAYVMKSTDYGANWTAYQFSTNRDRIKAVEAIGNNIWVSSGKAVLASSGIYYSANGGTNFNFQLATPGSSATAVLRINPANPNKCMVWGDGGENEWTYSGGFTNRSVGLGTGDGRADYVWLDPDTAGRAMYIKGGHLINSDDLFVTTTDTNIGDGGQAGVIGPFNIAGDTGLLFGAYDPASGSDIVGYLTSEADTGPDERGGANVGTPPYTDSVPGVVSLSEYGLWWGTPAAGKGIYVYADEQGDVTDIPDYDGLGKPLFGDRASFRNRNVDGFRNYHAEDARRAALEMHTPIPTGNDGYGIKEVGGYWVNTSEALVTSGDLHDPVTLDSDAAVLLDLTGQEIGLDTQSANTIFAGPATGAANEPTFRAVVAADLGTGTPDGTKFLRDDLSWQNVPAPAHALDDHTDVDLTGTGAGDIIYNDAGTWKDYPLGVGATFVIDSGKLKIGGVAGGNYLQIDLTLGTVRLIGDATSWDDLRVAASVVKPGATAPSYKAFGPSGNLQALMFEAGHHDEVHFEVQMPHRWKEGSNIYPHVHWTPTTADAGNVVWQLEYSWANINGTFGAPGNMATAATAAGGTAWVHKMTSLVESGNAYISGAGKTISSMLVCRLHRNSNSGSDTLNKDVAFLEIDFHYEVDSFGSDTETVKDYVPPTPPSNAPILEIQVFDDLGNVTGPLQDDGSDRLENEVMS